MGSRTALVEDLMERFPHVPREAVFKEDLLRGGVAFDPSALSEDEVGPYLVLRGGLRTEAGALEWCDEILKTLSTSSRDG